MLYKNPVARSLAKDADAGGRCYRAFFLAGPPAAVERRNLFHCKRDANVIIPYIDKISNINTATTTRHVYSDNGNPRNIGTWMQFLINELYSLGKRWNELLRYKYDN